VIKVHVRTHHRIDFIRRDPAPANRSRKFVCRRDHRPQHESRSLSLPRTGIDDDASRRRRYRTPDSTDITPIRVGEFRDQPRICLTALFVASGMTMSISVSPFDDRLDLDSPIIHFRHPFFTRACYRLARLDQILLNRLLHYRFFAATSAASAQATKRSVKIMIRRMGCGQVGSQVQRPQATMADPLSHRKQTAIPRERV